MFKAFCTRKECKLRGDKLFIFVFISVNKNHTCPILSTECVGSGRTNRHVFFGEKNNGLGHNPPPLNHAHRF